MGTKSFMFGFEGRINRAKYWLVSLTLLCAMISSLLLLVVICIRHHIVTRSDLHQPRRHLRVDSVDGRWMPRPRCSRKSPPSP